MTRTLFTAAVLAAPLSLATLHAQAADVIGVLHNKPEFSKLAMAVEAADMASTLKSGGPYTVFAPTNQAFEQLPQGAFDELLKDDNKSQLKALLQYHVVEGKKLSAKDAIGKQTNVVTVEGGSLSVDGTGETVLLVPTGLVVTRVGDQVIVERELAAVARPQVEVAPAGQGQQSDGQQATSGGQSGSDKSQQQASSSGSQSGSSQGQQQAASGQLQSGSSQAQGVLREAKVGEPDIQADNGLIHAIDAVLVPQSVLSKLESMPAQQSQGQSQQQGKANQG